ncbi:glycoside hydrolase family 65 protein [Bacillus horti]|uniref:Alpha,alpha-trehalose phosphorylase n=1 Tax=Caldalkalibacillus horti TaxID=77523 RepID=A0ABT9VVG7_9BACI|nr:glycosyl hydrolase family 65 protein [Bacillus horti]MDQ0164954.1 alpha,alpha-trehalose phosphorylase [Bacillus horti]
MTWKISSEARQMDQLLNEESLYFTGNGYIGVRGNFEEGYAEGSSTIRGTYLNAFHDIEDISYGEKLYAFPEKVQKLVNIIDAQTTLIYVGEGAEEERFSLFEGEVLDYTRTLHLDQGFTERSVHWRSPLGKEIKVTFKRLVSFTEKELFIQQVTIEPISFTGKVRMTSYVDGDVTNYVNQNDPRVASGHGKHLSVSQIEQDGEVAYVECKTERSELSCGCATVYHLSASARRTDKASDSAFKSEFHFVLNETVKFEKKTVFVDTLRHQKEPSLQQAAQDLHKRFSGIGFSALLEQQQAYLKEYWRNTDLEVEGEESIQEGVRFNLYHLLQSTGRDRFSNISAKGLSGEGYEGHYFWDTEIYMFPVFLLTNPELAKNLLLYRYSILEQAKERAKEMGHQKGALFPWRTISGTECSSFFPAGTAQYHISADIAYSYIQYDAVTQDREFMEKYGAEVLFETARLWMDTGHFYQGQFRLDAVTGPDEYTCVVNNNYYTNAMAKHNLKGAVLAYQRLQEETPHVLEGLKKRLAMQEDEVEGWQQAYKNMYLPYDAELNINPQDDSFLQKDIWDIENTPKEHFPLLLHYHPLTLYRYQVCKQADTVLAHFLLEDEQELDVIKSSYEYYEKVTTHDSSLSSCVFSIMASKIGEQEKAYRYFNETVRLDLDNTHGNTKDGLHMANMGGTWLAIVFGFAQLRIKEAGISLAPTLPNSWKGYAIPLQYQGRRLRLQVDGKGVDLQLLEGEKLEVHLYGEKVELSPQAPNSTRALGGRQ